MVNFNLMQRHGYSLSELEGMIPWEREIYLQMLVNYLEEKNKQTEHGR